MKGGRKPCVNVGERYGTRTVVSPAPKKHNYNGLRYLVRCDCGKEAVVYGYSLRKGYGCRHCKPKKPSVPRKAKECGSLTAYVQGCRCESCRAANAEDNRKRRSTERGRRNTKNANLKAVFGISLAQYEEMLAAQNNVCAICKRPQAELLDGRKLGLSVGHCHLTGVVRGLLCMSCNRGLGLFKESTDALNNAISYLKEKH